MPKFKRLFVRRYIGEGAFRKVKLLSGEKLVEKEAKSEWKRYANINEMVIWSVVKGTEFEEYFVPIIAGDSSGEWVIMPLVEVADRFPYSEIEDNGNYRAKTNMLERLGVTDLKPANRAKDGRVFDYGLLDNYEYDPVEVKKYLLENMERIRKNENLNHSNSQRRRVQGRLFFFN